MATWGMSMVRDADITTMEVFGAYIQEPTTREEGETAFIFS